MKFSFMTFSTPTLTWPEILRVAKQYGYDGVEPRITAKQAHGIEPDAAPAALAAARQQAADAGIAICCVATSCVFANPETSAANVASAKQIIALAHALGAPRLRVFGGQFPATITREQAIDTLAAALAQLAAPAAAAGVTLCLETHDAWTNPAHVAAVMRRVNLPSIAVNWDIMHPVNQSQCTIADSYAALAPWVRHLHVHDGIKGPKGLALAPIGTGVIDHRTALSLLVRDRYTGFISGEWIGWEPYDVHLPRELATLKSYLPAAKGKKC